jgi:hypothetical protein
LISDEGWLPERGRKRTSIMGDIKHYMLLSQENRGTDCSLYSELLSRDTL